jgi:pimeloyl-ACP methyl ester carboxylesterase
MVMKKFIPIILCFAVCKVAYATQLHQNTDPMLKKAATVFKDAIVEDVVIHPRVQAGSDERLQRRAILIRYPNAVATILLCHGFLCDKYDISCFRNMFPVGRFNFVTFDFRGHGEDNEGQISTLGHDEALDVIAAAEFVHQHPELKDKPLFQWGFSMGAVAAIEAQATNGNLFAAMIVDSPYDSIENVIKHGFDQMKMSIFGYSFNIPGRALLEKYALHPYVQSFVQRMLKVALQWDTRRVQLKAIHTYPIQSVKNISIPCFFIHCKNDEKIKPQAIAELYKEAGGFKRLWITEGRRHFDSFFYNPEQYAYRVSKFLEQVLDKSLFQKQESKIIHGNETDVL